MRPYQTSPVISLHNVSLLRDEVHLLKNITWQVRPGEHWAIIGPNGAGKTMLLKIIAGYLWPSRGTVRVLSEQFGSADIQGLRQYISWVSSALEQELPGENSVLETVASGAQATLRLFNKPKKEILNKAKKLLQHFDLLRHAPQEFASLSVGEKKKALLARALMHEPSLMILDEVCAGLDPVARQDYLKYVRKITRHSNKITVLFVTHHLEELVPEITHVLGLRKGKALFSGEKFRCLNSLNMKKLFGSRVKLINTGRSFDLAVF